MAIAVKKFPGQAEVDYDTIRHKIRSGDILTCSGNAWFSKLNQHASDSIEGNGYNGGRVLAGDRVSDQTLRRYGQFAVDLFGYPHDRK
jgi:hypothetical protein